MKKIGLGLVIVVLIVLGVKLWRISIPARSLYGTYTWARTVTDGPGINRDALEISDVQSRAQQTHTDLVTLQKELAPLDLVIRNLGWVPTYGGDIQASPELLAMGISMTEAGNLMLTSVAPVLDALEDDSASRSSILPLGVQTLSESGEAFEQARVLLKRAEAQRQEIDTSALSPRVASQIERLDQVWPFVDLGFDVAAIAPDLLGANGPQTYLIIAQNNDELRATGGFMTSVGTVTIDEGDIVNIVFEDVYAVDDFSQPYPDSPPQLLRYMLSEIWVFRDANWSPDFPTSVEAMLDLYKISRDTQIDGVIAVDQLALQRIVAALEPVEISGWDEAATEENVIRLIREQWSPDQSFEGWNLEWWQQRKGFIGELVAAMRQRVEQSPGTVDWPKFVQAVRDVLDQRNVQIWVADETAQQVIRSQKWDGHIEAAPNDYLMVVDTNLGFNKVNAVISQTLTYDVTLTRGEGAEARLSVVHENHSQRNEPCWHYPRAGIDGADYWEIINRCYWNYLRVYAPLGSKLVDATPHRVPGEFLLSEQEEPAQIETLPPEGDKANWGTLLLVPHDSQVETSLHYELPAQVVERVDGGWQYQLTVQKQAGTQAIPLQVTIQLPVDSRLITVSPPPVQSEDDNRIHLALSLLTDQEIKVVFE